MQKVNPFKKATQIKTYARIALFGASGYGKTFSALQLATGLADGGRIALIDTERGSAAKYADLFEFDVLPLDNFHPQNYIDGINSAVENGYSVLIIDSLSHAWEGEGGVLDLHDEAVKRQKIQNSFTAWKEVTPIHRKLVDTMLQAQIHLIVTMRAKMEYVLEKDESTGKNRVRKIGLKPIQREGLEYEFDIVGDMSEESSLIVTKTRYSNWKNKIIPLPNPDHGKEILEWVNKGEDPKKVIARLKKSIKALMKDETITDTERERIEKMLSSNPTIKNLEQTEYILTEWINKRKQITK